MTQESDATPDLHKRSFRCPHCRAFSGHSWNKLFAGPVGSEGVPYSAEMVATLAALPHLPPNLRTYAKSMLDNNLPFLFTPGSITHAQELVNSALSTCAACGKSSFWIAGSIIFPEIAPRSRAPAEVPREIASDFNEAAIVLAHSPKASAALSRRCLQALLRDKGFAQKDLANAIQALLDSKTLPSSLAENVDHIRNVGNFAAHPMKDTNTGAILDVEPHEAEWNLDVLESLFDFFYVGPAKDAQRRATYNAKLAQAGKPPMK